MLWLDPALARGVLRILAEHQATETSPFHDAAPGKIMHETRKGEMARLRELPFGKYYGGVDTTPLFVVLAGSYAARTGDLDLIAGLWPSLVAAMGWIEGERRFATGTGSSPTPEAPRRGSPTRGGRTAMIPSSMRMVSDASGPIALVEVQGYVYAALRAMADLPAARRAEARAPRWGAKADRVQEAVERSFWLEDLGTYALALDGSGQPCRVRTSNPGIFCLSGLPQPDRARAGHGAAAGRGLQLGLGDPHACRRRVPLQPDVLSQRLGLAARHRPMRRRNGTIRRARQRGEAAERHVRNRGQVRHAAAGAVLRVRAAGRGVAHRLSRRMPAAGLGVRVGVHAAAGMPGPEHRWLARRNPHPSAAAAHGIDRITIRHLAVGGTRVDLIFQRIGERVVAYPEGGDPGAIPVISHA